MSHPTPDEPLGHGDHWISVDATPDETVEMIMKDFSNGSLLGSYPAPWKTASDTRIVQTRYKSGDIYHDVISGKDSREERPRLLSAFPCFPGGDPWEIRIVAVHDFYGEWEGVIEGETSMGHPLMWFAPRFGFERTLWIPGQISRVRLCGLALSIDVFEQESGTVLNADLPPDVREWMQGDGQADGDESHPEAFELSYDDLRTVYSSYYDHHVFVGHIVEVSPVSSGEGRHGWKLDVACMPEDAHCGKGILPLWVFSSALADDDPTLPSEGLHIEGTLWLTGEWEADLSEEETVAWRANAGNLPI